MTPDSRLLIIVSGLVAIGKGRRLNPHFHSPLRIVSCSLYSLEKEILQLPFRFQRALDPVVTWSWLSLTRWAKKGQATQHFENAFKKLGDSTPREFFRLTHVSLARCSRITKQMLQSTSGRERTPEDFFSLFENAGLSLERVYLCRAPQSIIEARLAWRWLDLSSFTFIFFSLCFDLLFFSVAIHWSLQILPPKCTISRSRSHILETAEQRQVIELE